MRIAYAVFLLVAANALAQSPAVPHFDAASVRIADPGGRSTVTTGGPGTDDPGRIRYTRVPMIFLLQRAFAVATDQVSGADWIKDPAGSDLYEVTATMPANTTKEQFQLMLQGLLAERFHPAFHHETRNFSGYVLSVAKGGAKVKESTPDPNYVAPLLHVTFNKDGTLQLPAMRGATKVGGKGVAHAGYREVPMERLASDLGFMVVRSRGGDTNVPLPRVIDRTGLTGIYDFTLDYECLACGTTEASEPSAFPNIFTALEKQLGLKLEKAQDVPVDVIVIDKMDKIPAAN